MLFNFMCYEQKSVLSVVVGRLQDLLRYLFVYCLGLILKTVKDLDCAVLFEHTPADDNLCQSALQQAKHKVAHTR